MGLYGKIAVAVDNSEHSRHAERMAMVLAGPIHAPVTGYHVYSGLLHQARFLALEEFLPGEYRTPEVLEYQRRVHSVLIDRGLEIISSEYLKPLRDACAREGIPFREVLSDGKRADLLCDATSGHDLMVLGAQGIGRIDGMEGLGGTAGRVLQGAACDLFIARSPDPPRRILVGIDGSDASFACLDRAIGIGKEFGAELTLLAAFNPALHRSVFSLLSGVLSEEAGKVFRFGEQEDLHNRIIDRSLADLYRGHLETGLARVAAAGLRGHTVLGEGPAWHALCTEARAGGHDLLVVGRFGMHRGPRDRIGSNALRVAEGSPGNVLVVGGVSGTGETGEAAAFPRASMGTETLAGELTWDEDARKRVERIPSFARPMAMLAIERYARERGIDRITSGIMDEARRKFGL